MPYLDTLDECNWLPHPYLDNIVVSDNGRVLSYRRGYQKELKPSPDQHGYLRVGITFGGNNCIYIHTLVAETFVPNPLNLPEVHHKDANPLNNCPSNLEWCTQSYNIKIAYDMGTKIPSGRPVRIVETGEEFPTLSSCARYIKGDPGHIWHCLHGIKKTHRGFHFEYI